MELKSGEKKEFNIAICVPFHKCELSDFEKISLKQLLNVLKRYEIIFVVPESLNASPFDKCGIKFELFKDEFFESQKSYSRLMLEKAFYKRFASYDYILIYQLDSFVFSDKLTDFCRLGYDYIGAPGIVIDPYLGTLFKGKKYYHWENGGLSLRKVQSFIRVLDNIGDIKGLPYEEYLYDCEDFLYSYLASDDKYGFTMAPLEIASTFSVEFNLDNSFQRIKNGELPFGTHAWYKLNYDMWKAIIEKHGYRLPEIDAIDYVDTGYYSDIQWKIYYICREASEKRINHKDIKGLGKYTKNLAIYGYGKYGKTFLWMLETLGITPRYIIDKKKVEKQGLDWIHPEFIERKKYDGPILIAVLDNYCEIEKILKSNGYINHQDFENFISIISFIYKDMREKLS